MITIRLFKPLKDKIVTYHGEVLERSPTAMLIRARWDHTLVDMGYVTFAPGDLLYEHFYTDRWYNVYELRSAQGQLKGWYCNITRPAIFDADSIVSEDLELDIFVSPDRATILILDEDEYALRNLADSDPLSHAAALHALGELRNLAERGEGPFIPRGGEGNSL